MELTLNRSLEHVHVLFYNQLTYFFTVQGVSISYYVLIINVDD